MYKIPKDNNFIQTKNMKYVSYEWKINSTLYDYMGSGMLPIYEYLLVFLYIRQL